MTEVMKNRRSWLQGTMLAAGAWCLSGRPASATAELPSGSLHLACNQYPWMTYYRREQRDFQKELATAVREVAQTGVQGFEPLADSPESIERLAGLLREEQLEMRSLYVNSLLHEANQVSRSIEMVLAIARSAQRLLNTSIIVVNPTPIRWGGPDDKSDEQLRTQAAALNKLAGQLSKQGLKLSYHNHDAELRMAARELHHMMVGTDPEQVTFCLDAHWIYRGAGNSVVALFDVVKLYGTRITELHLRQSRSGIWTEDFGEGDIDYRALAGCLKDIGVKPHLVIEQAVEKQSPHTMNGVEAIRRSREYAAEVFSDFA